MESAEVRHDAQTRVTLSRALGRFLAAVHHAGIFHPDLHPGNMLVRSAAGLPEFFLLDLHDARIGGSATLRQSAANLVLFNRWFILRTNRTDRLRFWRAYVVERHRLAGRFVVDYLDGPELERRTSLSNMSLWHSRATRCLGTNRRFRRIKVADICGHAVSEWNEAELAPILRNPDALFRPQAGPLLKDSRSSTVAVRELIVNGLPRRVVVKRFRVGTLADAAAAIIRAPACRKAWANGHGFADCLLPTARPLAMFQRRRFGLPWDGYLITELVPDAIDLRQAATDDRLRRERIAKVARLIRNLHACGWSHRDLKAANILMSRDASGAESAWLIDLVGASRPRRLMHMRRLKDLARLSASFHDLPCVTRTDRLRFLRTYMNWNLYGPGDWKRWWRCIRQLTLRKIAKNRRRGRPLA